MKNSFGDNDCKTKSAETCRCKDGNKKATITLGGKKIELDKLNKFSSEEIEVKLNGKVETISPFDAVEILHKKQEIKVNSAYSSTHLSFKA